MGFSRQQYWSGLPCPSPGDLPNAGIEPATPEASALQVDSLLLSHQGILLSYKKEWNNVTCSRDYHTEWSQTEKDKYHMISLMWNLKYGTNETSLVVQWVRIHFTMQETPACLGLCAPQQEKPLRWEAHILQQTVSARCSPRKLAGSNTTTGESHSVVSSSLRPHGLYSPRNSPGQNTGAGSLSLLQGNLPNPGIEPRSSALQADSLPAEPQGKPNNHSQDK